MCSCISDTLRTLQQFLLFPHIVLFVLIPLFVEGAGEEKMETDTDAQQPEKVKCQSV